MKRDIRYMKVGHEPWVRKWDRLVIYGCDGNPDEPAIVLDVEKSGFYLSTCRRHFVYSWFIHKWRGIKKQATYCYEWTREEIRESIKALQSDRIGR